MISELLGLTGWFCDATHRNLECQTLAGRWLRCFQFRRAASCAFAHLWSAIYPSARPQQATLEIALDLLVANCLTLLLRCHLRSHVSPLVIATDASESGLDELSLRALSSAVACHQLGIIDLNADIGGFQRAVELLERRPAVYAASEDDPECLKWRGPPQSGSRTSPFGPITLPSPFNPHLTSWSGGLGEPYLYVRGLAEALSLPPGEEDIAGLVRSAAPYAKIAVMASDPITECKHGRHGL